MRCSSGLRVSLVARRHVDLARIASALCLRTS
ncbi:putative leader peptide [Streptomyces sp. NPDC059063]